MTDNRSGSFAFPMTARDLVHSALRRTRVLAIGEEPDAGELEECVRSLNMMFGTWEESGAGIWRNSDAIVTVPGGIGRLVLDEAALGDAVGIGSRVKDVFDARVVESSSYQRSLGRWTRDDFQSLVNKTASGSPTVFYSDPQPDAAVLNVWPVPADDIQIAIEFERGFQAVTDASQFVDAPQSLHETVMLNLALRCAGIFGASLSDTDTQRAVILEQLLLDNSRPESYRIGAW